MEPPSIVAQSEGVGVEISAGGFNMTGGTVTLLAAPGTLQPGSALSLTPLAISGDGLTVTYITTGTEFIQSGPWQVQLQVAMSSSEVYLSPPGDLYVYPRL